jgi:hypothetical protein
LKRYADRSRPTKRGLGSASGVAGRPRPGQPAPTPTPACAAQGASLTTQTEARARGLSPRHRPRVLHGPGLSHAEAERVREGDEYTMPVPWWRPPFLASFAAGSLEFVLVE